MKYRCHRRVCVPVRGLISWPDSRSLTRFPSPRGRPAPAHDGSQLQLIHATPPVQSKRRRRLSRRYLPGGHPRSHYFCWRSIHGMVHLCTFRLCVQGLPGLSSAYLMACWPGSNIFDTLLTLILFALSRTLGTPVDACRRGNFPHGGGYCVFAAVSFSTFRSLV